ncbi:hypothetical protein VTN77DRAFT_701 [Rasamsonia byssochlamydoides]|uniref:uncharacterized protein n=1 Tax=Rasamsonia byssochlamydoides TaxID=89139 RepID=UPI003742EBE3
MLNSAPPPSSSPGLLGVKRSRSPDGSVSIQSHPLLPSLQPSSSHGPAEQQHQARSNTLHSTLTTSMAAGGLPSGNSTTSSFRNVSACNRCRLRKNRCDQRLPRCQSCEKAGVRCVGYDPITKREVPRSYVYFLETRVAYLERLLVDNGIEFKPAAAFDDGDQVDGEERVTESAKALVSMSESSAGDEPSNSNEKLSKVTREREKVGSTADDGERGSNTNVDRDIKDEERLDKLVSNIGMVSVQGTSDPRYLGSTSGISFARLVFAAVKSSVNGNGSDRSTVRPSERLPANSGGSTMRDSFFGLQARPSMKRAPFPDRELGERLVELYFEHANPQMPILHRGDFMELFDRIYTTDEANRAPRDLYLLNIVFAIGAGIIFEGKGSVQDEKERRTRESSPSPPSSKKRKRSSHQYQPEEYHASAVVHLEAFLGSAPSSEGFGGGLEELQAVLLLASFALLRPVAPGLWYIVGVAVRLAIDLGLHYEDGTGIDSIGEEGAPAHSRVEEQDKPKIDSRERGRREWVRDFRRRLWWCVYSFDRLVSTCVGRPFGITDQVITTEFPSMLDDRYITKAGFLTPPKDAPSYKRVSHHYFKLRLLQSEIQQVLQYQQARFARRLGKNSGNSFMHTKLPSPFLYRFDSFSSWRRDVHRRLVEWKDSAPTRQETGVQFSVEFLELNYWQALIMLYRQSLTVPAPLAGELSPTEDVSSPPFFNVEESEDEDEIYLRIAEAGQKVLRIYRQLHRVRLVNYTYLATHHLFMAGISFLYAIWHSPVVRSRLTLDDVDFTVLAATSVLGDLMEKCPPAEACRDAFERMSRATVQMCLSTTGFGSQADVAGSHLGAPLRLWPSASHSGNSKPQKTNRTEYRSSQMPVAQRQHSQTRHARSPPNFDMNLDGLFTDQTPTNQDLPTGDRRQSNRGGRSPYQVQQAVSLQPEQSHEQYPSNAPYIQPYGGYDRSPSQQPQFLYANSPQSISSSGAPQSYTPPPQNPEQETFAPISLDFLDFGPGAGQNAETGSDGNPAFNTLSMPSFGQGGGQGTGLNLGFGMEVDYQHDWSEGGGYDLFDGFFFGGSGGGANNTGV